MESPIDLNQSKQPDLLALVTIMMVAAIVAVVIRFWSCHLSAKHKYGFDDLFALLSLPSIIAFSGVAYWWLQNGLGRPAAALPPSKVAKAPIAIFAAEMLFASSIAFPKFSVLFFYRRVFMKTAKWFNIALWAVGVLNAGWLISAWITTILQCVPVQATWSPELRAKGAKCFSTYNWFLGTSLASMLIDLTILLLPIPRLWNIQAKFSEKCSVIMIFVCGYAVFAVSIARFVSVIRAGESLVADLTWRPIPFFNLVIVEESFSLISVCLPSIIVLMKKVHRDGPRAFFLRSYPQSATSEWTGSSSRQPSKVQPGGERETDVDGSQQDIEIQEISSDKRADAHGLGQRSIV